jgi:hypothetical protein
LAVLTVSVEPDAETSRQFRGVNLEEIRRNVEEFARVKRPGTEIKLSIVAHAGNFERIAGAADYWGPMVSDIKVAPRISFDGTDLSGQCREPWRGNLIVFSDGKVSPCCVDPAAALVMGDIHTEPLSEIVHGPAFRALLSRFIYGGLPDCCTRCRQFSAPGLPVKAPKRPHRRR